VLEGVVMWGRMCTCYCVVTIYRVLSLCVEGVGGGGSKWVDKDRSILWRCEGSAGGETPGVQRECTCIRRDACLSGGPIRLPTYTSSR